MHCTRHPALWTQANCIQPAAGSWGRTAANHCWLNQSMLRWLTFASALLPGPLRSVAQSANSPVVALAPFFYQLFCVCW